MVETKDCYLPSSDGAHQLFVRQWLPAGQPRAVLQMAHGVNEHILRYGEFAEFLAQRGFLVIGNDHLGHGRTAPEKGDALWFAEEGGWTYVVDDLRRVCEFARGEHPGIPYFFLGHSMGSFLLRTYLIRYPGGLTGALISGTEHMPGGQLAAGQAVAALLKAFHGTHHKSNLVQTLVFGAYNKKFAPNRTTADWLTRDEAVVDAFRADRLCGRRVSVGLFRDMLGGLAFIKKPAELKKMDLDLPVLFFAGDQDPVGRQGQGVRDACAAFRAAGCRDVSMKLYPGARHEMLGELNRAEVFGDLLAWMEEKMK